MKFTIKVRNIIRTMLLAAFVLVQSPIIYAKTFTWAPGAHILSDGTPVVQLPTVTITGQIDWGFGSFDSSFVDIPSDFSAVGNNQQLIFFLTAVNKGGAISSVCTNPTLSPDLKLTTSSSDATTRWLAAQSMFITGQAEGILDVWINAGVPITLLIDSKSYQGYKVFYADGYSEVWVINPGWRTSTFKLFDLPAPSSLLPPTFTKNNPNICVGAG